MGRIAHSLKMGMGDVPQDKTATHCWTFANAQFDERTLELSVGGRVVELERKPLDVLRFLLANANTALSQHDIYDAVWPGRILSESVLKKCISRLREVLGDEEHRLIKTVHGFGYRFMPPVTLQEHALLDLQDKVPRSSVSAVRHGAVLIADVADAVFLQQQLGESESRRKIKELIDAIIAVAREHHGELIKSYGDDVLAVFERDPVANAAEVAIKAQRLADMDGLKLYAGFHVGDVEFRDTLGHPDALGLTVNTAARLHKLTPGAAGQIFFTKESLGGMPARLRIRANRFGSRELKGIGAVEVWTLRWQDTVETIETVFSQSGIAEITGTNLLITHETKSVRLEPRQSGSFVGRGKSCALRILDPDARVSTTHLLLETRAGQWLVQDVSRNGTWMRRDSSAEETPLPHCTQVMLPREGSLSLGRSFADDPSGRFRIDFQVGESSK